MDKYRNEDVNEFMKILEDDLTAIVGKEFGNLDVAGILKKNRKDNPEMSIEQAIMWAMRDKAAVILRKSIALAISLDRMTVMVEQMADEMGEDGNQNSERYRNRSKVLTDFNKIIRQLR